MLNVELYIARFQFDFVFDLAVCLVMLGNFWFYFEKETEINNIK